VWLKDKGLEVPVPEVFVPNLDTAILIYFQSTVINRIENAIDLL